MSSIAYVRVYLDDDVPEYMQGVIRCGSVFSDDEDGKELKTHEEIIDNTEYHSAQELINDVASRLGVSPEIVEIQS